jgi:hypothetical protein
MHMLTHDDLSAAVFSGTHMIRGCGIYFRSGFNIVLYSVGIESEDFLKRKKKKEQDRQHFLLSCSRVSEAIVILG